MRMDVTELPFDQYQRYRLVTDVLERVRPAEGRLRVLDVGGRTALLRRFLPEDRVELVDVEASDEPGLVLGDGSRLPFRDASFDAVVTFDTLEHVPPGRREDFVRECRRVARRWVVIAGPYRTPEVDQAEHLLRELLDEKLHERHRYLEEHHENGLPEREVVEDLLRELGARVVTVGHGNLERWLPLMCIALYLDRDAPLRPIARELFRYYNRTLYDSDHAEPVYRHAIVAALGDAELPDPGVLFDPAPPVPAALAPIEHLGRELLRFDVQRDVVSAEWARLEAANRELETDVAGHRQTIAALRSEAAGLRVEEARLIMELSREQREGSKARKSLERDLAAHARTIANQVAELEALRKELEREQREGHAARADLEANLAAHAATIADQLAEITALREDVERERREDQAARDVLEADLAGHRGRVAALEEELEARHGDLRAALAEVDNLRALLEDERRAAAGTIAALSEDLAGHRAALAARGEELDHQRQHFEAERAALAAHVQGLEAELTAHRAVQAELGSELEAHRQTQVQHLDELARTQAHARALEAELARQGSDLSSAQEQLVETRFQLDQTRRELGAERELVASLRAELRDRWRSLKRAFARKEPQA